jgi:large subunit ribosomal protein L24
MEKIRKGDQVIVLSGRDKGRHGAVLRVVGGTSVLVEKLNLVKKHQKPNPQQNVPGGIIEKEMPLPIGKVAIWNSAAKKADRVGIKALADGKRVQRGSDRRLRRRHITEIQANAWPDCKKSTASNSCPSSRPILA